MSNKIFKYNVNLVPLRVANQEQNAFRDKLNNIPYLLYQVENLASGEIIAINKHSVRFSPVASTKEKATIREAIAVPILKSLLIKKFVKRKTINLIIRITTISATTIPMATPKYSITISILPPSGGTKTSLNSILTLR